MIPLFYVDTISVTDESHHSLVPSPSVLSLVILTEETIFEILSNKEDASGGKHLKASYIFIVSNSCIISPWWVLSPRKLIPTDSKVGTKVTRVGM